jgi:hypothetical protein
MLSSLLLLMNKKVVPSAVALGIGTACKYFPFFLLPAALVYLKTTRQRLLYAAVSILTVAVIQLPFVLTEFQALLDNVLLYHINRPASGATLYNLLTPHPQFFGVQTPLTLLSPISLILAYLFIAYRRDKSDVGLFKNAAFLMLVSVFFNKVVLFYALWFIPLLYTFLLATRKRNLALLLVPFLVLQISLLLGWQFYDVSASAQSSFALAYVYLAASGLLLAWLFCDRLKAVRNV